MIIKPADNSLRDFFRLTKEIYRYNEYYRATEDEVIYLLIKGSSSFLSHATVKPFIIQDRNKPIGRFALIHDQRLPDYIQVSFFEILPAYQKVVQIIIELAKKKFKNCKRIIFGLNGHLNYGAGFLLNRFDKIPLFGLPYTPQYYQEYFSGFKKRSMVSFRFPFDSFYSYYQKTIDKVDFDGISVRKMDKKKLKKEIEIYTWLNNVCFREHPYWADRNTEEDLELFYPFRFLMKEENLLFAEKDGNPVGFFLWYPDFNQLVRNDKRLGMLHVLRYRMMNPINTFRFTEIAVLPEYMRSRAAQAMMLTAIPFMHKQGFEFGEGGFIFEENVKSINMTKRFIRRATGNTPEPYRKYAVFEKEI